MKRLFGLLLIVTLAGCSTLQGMFDNISNSLGNNSSGSSDNDEPSTGNPSFVRQKTDYTIRNSVDKVGNLYISYQGQLPSVMTFVNRDGSVTVCSSDENAKITYIYEYSMNLELQKTFNIPNELGQLGAFTKDTDGNYYFFYGAETTNQNSGNMAMVKCDKNGTIIIYIIF